MLARALAEPAITKKQAQAPLPTDLKTAVLNEIVAFSPFRRLHFEAAAARIARFGASARSLPAMSVATALFIWAVVVNGRTAGIGAGGFSFRCVAAA
jgi:hypothetical protein